MSDDLVEWLRLQLDEDERVAKAAIQGPWRTGAIADHLVDDVIYGTSPYAHGGPGGDKIVQVANLEMAWEKEANAAHIIRWDPSRVLREVEAKRKILDEIEEHWDDANPIGCRGSMFLPQAWDSILRLLAEVYSDRPGYRKEWRPA